MNEPKPCPFCGGEAVIDHHQWWDTDEPPVLHDTWQIGCAKETTKDYCCIGRLCHSRGHKTKGEAIAAWNRRATERTCRFNVVINQDPTPRRRGNICECDACGYRCAYGFIVDERFKFCPSCGARIEVVA